MLSRARGCSSQQTVAGCRRVGEHPLLLREKCVWRGSRWLCFLAVVCGGVDAHTHTHTTPSPCGPDVWLLNWSDGLEGRSRHSRSHYSTLCSLTLGVCVCTSLTYNLRTHVTHALCVFCARFRRFGLLQRLACCWVLKNHLYCTHKHTHTHRQSGRRGKDIQVVCSLSLLSNPHQHVIPSDHWGKKFYRSSVCCCCRLAPLKACLTSC